MSMRPRNPALIERAKTQPLSDTAALRGLGRDRWVPPVVVVALAGVTGAVNLQVPLYPTYARVAGTGIAVTAVAFALYVAGLLPVLLLLGGASDRLGRRPVLAAGLTCALAATILMWTWPQMEVLFVARVLQGIGVGLCVGTGTATLAETHRGGSAVARAASQVAFTTALGFGGGALLTSVALWSAPSLRPWSYGALSAVLLATLAASVVLPMTRSAGLPLVRRPTLVSGTAPACVAISIAWAVTGLVISVVPSQLATFGLAAWAGPALFLVNATGAFVQPTARRMDPVRAQRLGLVLLPVGYALLVAGTATGSLPLVLFGSCVAGSACYGFTYLGGLALVAKASGAERARAVSGYFVYAYLGFSLPSIAVGVAAEHVGLIAALSAFGILVVASSAALWRPIGRIPDPD